MYRPKGSDSISMTPKAARRVRLGQLRSRIGATRLREVRPE